MLNDARFLWRLKRDALLGVQQTKYQYTSQFMHSYEATRVPYNLSNNKNLKI